MIVRAEQVNFHGPASTGGFGLASVEGAAVLACPETPGEAPESSRRFATHTVPDGMDRNAALLAPELASALNAWEELRLELGEAVVLAGTGRDADLLALTAVWHGACPVIRIGDAFPSIGGVEFVSIDADEPESDMLELSGRLEQVPAVKCIDLTGEAATVDILLEVLPQYFRLMLAGERSELLTLDYYVNIHRKGAHVLARQLDPAGTIRRAAVEPPPSALERAFRLLASEDRSRSVVAAAGETVPGPRS